MDNGDYEPLIGADGIDQYMKYHPEEEEEEEDENRGAQCTDFIKALLIKEVGYDRYLVHYDYE